MEIKKIEQKEDRIKLVDIWARNMQKCNETFGTNEYPNCVRCFQVSLVDIKNGPQLKTKVDEYEKTELEEWKKEQMEIWRKENPKLLSNRGWIKQKSADVDSKAYEKLYVYIVQLLQDKNYGITEFRKLR